MSSTALSLLITATFAVTIYTLWVRRTTWRVGWETATTVNVIGLSTCMLLIPPYLANLWGPPLHAITGIWNLQDLIGHITYLIGISALLHTVIHRLALPDRERLIRQRIEVPATIVLPTLIAMFLVGAPDQPIVDLISAPMHGWLAAYWLMLCAAAGWIIGHLIWALTIMRRDSRHVIVANIYLVALALDGCCVACLVLHVFCRAPGWPAWVTLCAACVGYVVAAWVSWERKLRWFKARSERLGLGLQTRFTQ